MSLERQVPNIILYQGIDTKTNSKLVEGKLLEMENCEINNQKIVKSPGTDSLAETQTAQSIIEDQKGVTTAYNTMIVADNNSLYKYNSDQDVLNKIENAVFSKNNEYNIVQNISELYQIPGAPPTNLNQLYSPYTLLGASYSSSGNFYAVPEPISCQWDIYLFTVVFIVTGNTNGLTGYYQINLLNTLTNTQIYQSNFPFTFTPTSPPGPQQLQVPADCIGTPAGIFMYTIDYANGHVFEYFMTFDLSLVHMSPDNPLNSNIFPSDAVWVNPASNPSSYVYFLSVEYSDEFIFYAFRKVTTAPSFRGMIAVRDLASETVLSPQVYTPPIVMGDNNNNNLCTLIFYHPDTMINYFAVLFGNTYVIIDTSVFANQITPFTGGTSTYSTHSLGFLSASLELVALIHDITEFNSVTTPSNRIAPTVNKYQLTQTAPDSLNLTVTPTLTGIGDDPRWVAGSYGTSAIAGRIICIYDKILFPILYFAYITVSGAQTPSQNRRSSAHLVQFIQNIDFPSPLSGMTNILNHVTWIKDYNCSLFNYGSPNFHSAPPTIMRSKIVFTNEITQSKQLFYGFFVQESAISLQGKLLYSHQFNTYSINITSNFDFQGFPRSAFYMGSGKLYELANTTLSEMGFFDFPQISYIPFANYSATAPILNGKYLYSAYYEWVNGNGELVRSAVSEIEVTIAAPTGAPDNFIGVTSVQINTTPEPFFSNKLNAVTKIFRSTINGSVSFFDGAIPILPTLPIFIDTNTDAMINNNSLLYTYGGILEDFPFAAIGAYTLYNNSIFVINENNPNQIQFSKGQTPGIGLTSADGFYTLVESVDGGCKFLQKMDDKIIIFKENSLYFMEGQIPDDTGANSTLTQPQFITSPVGCNQPNSVVVFPQGIIFKSKKGIWQLDRSLSAKYIGADVEAYNNLTITSAQLFTEQNKVKFSSLEGTNLVYDYFYSTWNIETFPVGFYDSTIVDDRFTTINMNGVISAENNNIFTRNNQNYTMKFTTGWVKLTGLIGYQRLYKIMFLGDYVGSHILKASIYFNYNEEPSEFHYFNPTQNLGIYNAFGNFKWGDVLPYAGYKDSTYLFRINVVQQKCTSVKITLEDLFTGLSDQNGASFTATALNFDIGVKSATAKVPSRLQT